ncbi:MAG: DNA polymerase III subunit gamma/tau [Phycisphaerales bacterium]
MTYTVLARRYRSRTFDELVGQEAVARTLLNAIAQDRVAHAYLFVGTRGVGKTSTARIFAKALAGGSAEVDTAIMSGQDTDVIEIDAASNRGVEDARELIAKAAYRPLRGKFKVYIIDEVHMLTKDAFNTLLKLLEEPPEHVKFILCTTESEKVIPTIRSRCQRFDFRPIPIAKIAEHLSAVLKQEKLKAEGELVHAVARLGNGSMRDALSLLDRVIAATPPGETMTVGGLEKLLGLPEREAVLGMVDAMAAGDAGAALQGADALLAQGVSIDQLIETLVLHLRDLMILCACGGDSTLVDLTGPARERAAAQAARFDAAGLVHMIALCESVGRAASNSSTARALLDALIVRLAMTEKLADVGALLSGGGGTALKSSPQTTMPSVARSGAGAETPTKKR